MIRDTIEITVIFLQNLTQQAQTWAKHHASKFDINKFQLVHFASFNKKISNNSLIIRLSINNYIIELTLKTKYLEVLIDSYLF